MIKRRLNETYFLIGIIAVILVAEAVHGADDMVATVKLLQGSWQAVKLEGDGKPAPDEIQKSFQMTIKDDKMIITMRGAPNRDCKFKLDPSDPNFIDITGAIKGKEGDTLLGIFSLEGDQLKICFPETKDLPRPTEFTSSAGSHLGVMILKRVKAE